MVHKFCEPLTEVASLFFVLCLLVKARRSNQWSVLCKNDLTRLQTLLAASLNTASFDPWVP
jgi:hypothetical protein